MDEPVPWYVSLIVSWLPFLLMLGVWAWIVRAVSKSLRTADGKSLGQVVELYGQELKRQNDLIEQLLSESKTRLVVLPVGKDVSLHANIQEINQ